MDPLAELVGESPAMEAVRDQIRRLVAHRETGRRLPSVLLQGETGSGKGLVARVLHRAGPRARAPFVDLNCAAMPEHLVESELFGYERGAFTDARRAKPGLFQTAHRGVIFLDEIGELREPTQAKLLKVLEEGVVRRLGATETEPADVWVISATNADLEAAVRQRAFREDLYHRLAVLTLRLPPLRERGRDVIVLARRFLDHACTEYGLSPKRLSPDAEERILRHPWPGNVRELDNVMERVALLAEGDNVTASMLELRGGPEVASVPPPASAPASASLEEAMRDHLLAALEQTRWNISRTAALLDISRNTVRARIERFGLRPSTGSLSKSHRSPPSSRTVPVLAHAPEGTRPPPVVGPPVPIRWDRRRVTFLRVRLLTRGDDELLLEAHRALDVVLEKAQSFGGRIEELSPHGIGALFGLEPVEDAPRRAAHAAMAIQKAAERARREGTQGFAVKTGIHVGEVFIGHDRVRVRIDAESEREHWNILDLMLGQAEPGVTLVNDTAMPFLERRFELVSEPGLPLSTHRLQGRERKGLAPEGHMATFVGRALELSVLMSRFETTKGGNGQVVGVVGDAGIGKSRLLHEFRQALRGERVTYLEGHCLSYGSEIPYLPVLEVLRRACRIGEGDSPVRVRRQIHRTLEQLGLSPEEGTPYLMRFLGFKEEPEKLDGVTPEAIRTNAMQILRQMCLASTHQRPLVIVLEDLHWIDPASESLGSLLGHFWDMPLLLIFTYRPEYRPSWLDTSHVTQLSLQPLSAEESMSLLRGLLPSDRLTEPDAREILGKAEGNPFFLEELGRTVREQGALGRASVPHTVQTVLWARIHRLPDRERHVLQSAAVIGTEAPVNLLKAITDLSEPELSEALVHLRTGEFLHEASLGLGVAFVFKHALTHEVTYASLREADRRRLHARIAGELEALGEGSSADFIDRYAHHAYEGQLWEAAARQLNEAGVRAFTRSANRVAVTLFERAIEALGHLPDTPESLARAIDLHLGIRNALTLLGDVRGTLEHLRQAATLAERLGDQARLGRSFSFAANALYLSGDQRGAISAGERALRIADALSDFRLRTATSIYLGRAYQALGDYRRALRLFHEVVESLQGDLMRDHLGLPVLPAVFARSLQVWCMGETGQFSDGSRLAEEAIRLAESTNHPDTRLWAYRGAGLLELARGEAQQAANFLVRAREVCRTYELPVYVPVIDCELGHAYAMLGRTGDGLPLLENAVQQATARKQVAILAQMMLRLGDGKLRVGLVDEAASIGARALELSQKQEDQGSQAHSYHLLGEVARLRGSGHLEAAEKHYVGAETLAERCHMRPMVARCRLGLGLLWAAREDHAQAKLHLTEAVSLFRDMNMLAWLDRGTSALRALYPAD